MQNRVAGTIAIKVNGQQVLAAGSFTGNLGLSKREAKVGEDGVHGYKEEPQAPYLEGDVTVPRGMGVREFVDVVDATVTVEFANGMTWVYGHAWFAGEGDYDSNDGNLKVRYEARTAKEI